MAAAACRGVIMRSFRGRHHRFRYCMRPQSSRQRQRSREAQAVLSYFLWFSDDVPFATDFAFLDKVAAASLEDGTAGFLQGSPTLFTLRFLRHPRIRSVF